MFENYSVLMSVYAKESATFLKESIESILGQTKKTNDFIIVIDGPLTESLDNLLNEYQHNYHEIKLIRLKKNVGLGLALNEGLKNCKNELVARMDSDDIALPDRCDLQIKEFNKKPNLSILGTQIAEFYDSPSKIESMRIVPVNYNDILKFSKRRSPFNHPTVMYKKSEIISIGGYNDVKRKEDLDLFLCALSKGFYAQNLNNIGLYFRSNKDNYLRRKDKVNCKSYITTIYKFTKRGYCSWIDFLYVFASQVFFLISPNWLMKKVSDKFLRRKA